MPTNSRSSLRTWPKLVPGCRCCTRLNTSPRAVVLPGSHQPLPSCVTRMISPLARRYLRQFLVLSALSSCHGGGSRSSSAEQLTAARERQRRTLVARLALAVAASSLSSSPPSPERVAGLGANGEQETTSGAA